MYACVPKKIWKINIFLRNTLNNFSFEQKQEPVLYFHLVGEIPLSFEISVYAILLSDSISWLFRVWHALRNKCLCGSLGHWFAPRRVERLGWRTIKKIHNTHKYTDYRTRLWSKVASMPRKLPPNCRGSMRAAFRGVKSQLRSRITRDDWQFCFNRILIPSLITWRYLRRRKKKETNYEIGSCQYSFARLLRRSSSTLKVSHSTNHPYFPHECRSDADRDKRSILPH